MRLDHPIFQTPKKVTIVPEEIATPKHYEHYATGPVPEKLVAWRVFHQPEVPAAEKGKPRPMTNVGLVSDGFGFEDSPDCEWISSGLNSKGLQSLALGRQANFFLWGFAAQPSLLTESARDVFENTVCWMKGHAGAKVLVAKQTSPREWIFVQLWAAFREGKFDRAAAERYLSVDALEKHGKDAAMLRAWYVDHLEAVTMSPPVAGEKRGRHVVDEDVVALGTSNRTLDFFAKACERWKADPKDALVPRVLARYVPDRTFADAADLETWLTANRGKLRFTDVGGYVWRVWD